MSNIISLVLLLLMIPIGLMAGTIMVLHIRNRNRINLLAMELLPWINLLSHLLQALVSKVMHQMNPFIAFYLIVIHPIKFCKLHKHGFRLMQIILCLAKLVHELLHQQMDTTFASAELVLNTTQVMNAIHVIVKDEKVRKLLTNGLCQ